MRTKFFTIMAVAAMAMIFTSCQKDEPMTTQVVHSSIIPVIECQGMLPNNIFVVGDPSTGSKDFTWTTNVPCLIGCDEGNSFLVCYNTKQKEPSDGALLYTLSWNENAGFTEDAVFAMVQSAVDDQYNVYDNYGAIETIVNYRFRGKKGTNYMNFEKPDDWNSSLSYYIKGKVKALSEVSDGSEEYMNCALKAWSGWLAKWGYVPATYNYDANYVTVTIETPLQGDVDVVVYGKARDKEIADLLDYIKVGDTIEVPAVAKDKKDVEAKRLQQIHASGVLKI